jgi:hypothetical protein
MVNLPSLATNDPAQKQKIKVMLDEIFKRTCEPIKETYNTYEHTPVCS